MVKIEFPSDSTCINFKEELEQVLMEREYDCYIRVSEITNLIVKNLGRFVELGNEKLDNLVWTREQLKDVYYHKEYDYHRGNFIITTLIGDPLTLEIPEEEEEELNAPVLNETIMVDYTKELDGIKKELHELNRNIKEFMNIIKRRK